MISLERSNNLVWVRSFSTGRFAILLVLLPLPVGVLNSGLAITFGHPPPDPLEPAEGTRHPGVRLHIERIALEKITGYSIPRATSDWLRDLDDKLYNKLARARLVKSREQSRLGDFLKTRIESRTDLKPGSLRKLGQTCTKLREFFGADRARRTITADEAADWRAKLALSLSEASVKIHTGNAKSIFKATRF